MHKKIQQLRSKIDLQGQLQPFVAIRAMANPVTTEDRLIKQYFCIFGIPDSYGTVPVKGCFNRSLGLRGPDSSSEQKIVVLNQHDPRDPLCVPIVLREDELGLYGEYEPDVMPSGDRLLTQIRSKTINQGSYGFDYIWEEMEYMENTGLILMHDVDLYEVSPVTYASQKETFVLRNKGFRQVIPESKGLDYEYLLTKF